MEEEVHQLRVSRITHALVVEVVHHAVVRFTQRAEPSRGGERLELHSADVEQLPPLHRRHRLSLPLLDHLAIVQVLVHDPLGRPVEGIGHEPGRVLRQRAHAQAQGTAAVEPRHQRRAGDADEARRQPALRRHDAARPLAQRDDGASTRHVLGEIEVVNPRRARRVRDPEIELVRQTGESGVDAPQCRGEAIVGREVDFADVERKDSPGHTAVASAYVEPLFMQESRRERSHVSQTQSCNAFEWHGRSPVWSSPAARCTRTVAQKRGSNSRRRAGQGSNRIPCASGSSLE